MKSKTNMIWKDSDSIEKSKTKGSDAKSNMIAMKKGTKMVGGEKADLSSKMKDPKTVVAEKVDSISKKKVSKMGVYEKLMGGKKSTISALTGSKSMRTMNL